MTEGLVLEAEPRFRKGKSGARETRRRGHIPAIVYGGHEAAEMLALPANQIRRQLSMNPRFFSSVCEIRLDRRKLLVIPREAQLHPATDEPMHLDFVRVARGENITVEVPVVFRNEEQSPGIRRGGVLNIVRHTVELSCPVENIPAEVEVDLATADIGDSLHISQVTLPPRVEPVISDRDFTIAGITPPSTTTSPEGEDEADAETEPTGGDNEKEE